MTKPQAGKSIATNGEKHVADWADAQKQLEQSEKFWLATTDPDGSPHVVPIFSVWVDDTLYFTSGKKVRKSRNLAQNAHCVISTQGETLDVMVEGEATKITDEAAMQRVAKAYADKYGWPIMPHDGAFDAPYGAPSAGPAPYACYHVRITKVFALGTSEVYGATRWVFE